MQAKEKLLMIFNKLSLSKVESTTRECKEATKVTITKLELKGGQQKDRTMALIEGKHKDRMMGLEEGEQEDKTIH